MAMPVGAQVAPGDVTFTADFPHVVQTPGNQLSMDVSIGNTSTALVTTALTIDEVPQGWSVDLLSKAAPIGVRSATVKPGETKAVQLQIFIPPDAKPGEFSVRLRAKSMDGKYDRPLEIKVTVRSPEAGSGQNILLNAQFGALRGPTGTTFAFTFTLRNPTSQPMTVNLGYQAEPNWEARVKPSFRDTYVASISVNANSSESLDLEVTPPPSAEPGEHPIVLVADAGSGPVSQQFTVNLTGTQKLTLQTVTGRLNSDAQAGEPSNVSLAVKNDGTGPIQGITLLAAPPQGWQVTFDPRIIDAIEPGGIRQVQAQVVPSGDVIPGDYNLKVTASSPQVSQDLNLVINATQSATWGWVGVGIVVVVILGLAVLFLRIGRR